MAASSGRSRPRAMRQRCPTSSSTARPSRLYALSEHALATRSPAVTAAAAAAFRRDRRPVAAMPRPATIASSCCRDWSIPPPGRVDYLAGLTGVRTHNTRIHLLEALTTYHELARTGLGRQPSRRGGGADRGGAWFAHRYSTSVRRTAPRRPARITATTSRPSACCCAPAPGSASAATRRRSIAGSSMTPCGWARTRAWAACSTPASSAPPPTGAENGIGCRRKRCSPCASCTAWPAKPSASWPSCARSTGSAAGRSTGPTARGTA